MHVTDLNLQTFICQYPERSNPPGENANCLKSTKFTGLSVCSCIYCLCISEVPITVLAVEEDSESLEG